VIERKGVERGVAFQGKKRDREGSGLERKRYREGSGYDEDGEVMGNV
jgi:hypothetical protein